MSKEEKEKLLPDDDEDYGTKEKSEPKAERIETVSKSASLKQLFRYADRYDAFYLTVGCIVCLVTGAGWPAMSMIFGGLSNTFINAQNSMDKSNFGTDLEGLMDKLNASGEPLLPQITKQMFTEQTTVYCLQYTYLGVAILICGYIQMACWITTCERQINQIRREFFYSIMRQDISWFDKNASGTLTTKLSDNLERIKEGIGDKFGLLIQYTAQCIAGVVIAMAYSWKMTLVMMSLSPLMVASSSFMAKHIAQSVRREQEKYSIAGAIAEEVLSCIRTVVSFNGQQQECDRYEHALAEGKKDGIMKNIWTGIGLSMLFLTMFCSYGLAFWYGSKLILWNEIERGDVFVVFFSVMMGSMALGNAGPQLATLAAAKGSAAAIFDIIDRKPDIDSYSIEGEKLSDVKGKVEFHDVFFSYPTRKEITVLNGISFAVEPGETVALVGPSGCGKSTTTQLLLRFYDPDSGKVTIDGHSLPDLNLQWLRNIIGVVSQEPVLFECSIEENIKMGRKNITFQEMVKACKMANAYEFISKLPDGFKTAVGEGGTALSGGQKQRVAIARALVRDPKILLLDEATSALDAESESIVQEALDKAQQGRTTIVIAHRLSTIRNASKIIAIDNGFIKEVGSHEELINLKGLYYDLVTNQVFYDPGSGYASGEEKTESEDSGTSVEKKDRRLSRRLSRQATRERSMSDPRRGSMGSETSDLSEMSASMRRKKMSRMLSHVDTEKERLKKELEEEGGKQSNLIRILAECKQEWVYLTLAMIGAAGRGLILPAFSFFYSEIFNTYSKSGEEMMKGAAFWSIMFVVLGVLNMVFTMMSVAFIGLSGENITMRLRMSVFRNVLRQDIGYFDDSKHSTGKICTRLATDAPNVKAAVDFRLAMVLTAVISMLGGCLLAFFFGWQMALVVLAIFPFFALGSYARMKLRTGSALRDAQLLEEAGKVAAEGIENIRTVQALTKEQTFFENFSHHIDMPYKEGIRQAHIQAISFAFAQSVFFFMYAICFRFGAFMVEKDEMSPVDVYRVFFAINFSGMMVGMATAYFPEYLKAKFSGGLVFKMINEEPKIDSCSEAGLKPVVSGSLSFEDVHFTYPARIEAPVLQGLNFNMKTGQTLALVGPSGCGKSTVVCLLERFYDPLSGSVKADDFDLRTINVPYMRRHISLVSQEPILFGCSIQENITYGLKNITHEQVVEAAKLANIHEFVKDLPQGYDTSVGEKGAQLSGGQKQRVAIARALVRNPKILLLDEATSALDTESEKIVQEAIDRAREGRTCIIIAHRLSTVQNADSIAVIKEGKVVEQGTHAELVTKRGAYYNLTKKQNLGV